MSNQRLAIIGGGPKAIAVAIKNKVLSELGYQVPRISIYEKYNWNANWDGAHGYTDGHQRLSVAAEKDVGYPYVTQWVDQSIAQEINMRMLKYSYAAFLIAKQSYGEYIDRASPSPTHRQWSEYLGWVADQTCEYVAWYFTEAKQISLQNNHWLVSSPTSKLTYDAVMITGLGKHKQIFPNALTKSSHILTSCDYWQGKCVPAANQRVAIIGGGENAASIAVSLIGKSPAAKIEIISPQATPYTRCESYAENRFFSEPDKNTWQALSLSERRQFIARTDIGVISTQAMQVLQQTENVSFRSAWLRKLTSIKSDSLVVSLEHAGNSYLEGYDWVILAIGFDFIAFLKDLFPSETQQQILQCAKLAAFAKEPLEEQIDYDLSLKNVYPKLFLPTLSGLMQGPGFPNLSCLGLLSDRVLSSCLAESEPRLKLCY